MAGKGWFNNQTNSLYLNAIDLDNQLAIEEICNYNGKRLSIEDLAKWTLVEQHMDDRSRLRLYVLSEKPFPQIKTDSSPIAIEVKSEGHHGYHYCTNSVHMNGHRYQILGPCYEPVLSNDFVTT
jgi:hypothetical protein